MRELLWKMKRLAMRRLWRRHRRFLLNRKGLRDQIVQDDAAFLRLFERLFNEGRTYMRIRELYNLYRLAGESLKVEGDMAEVGVYLGGSARVICEVKGDRALHLFDTFEGMPETDRKIDRYRTGSFAATSVEGVREYLKDFSNVRFHKGVFPGSAGNLRDPSLRFCFVNLDVDLYKSTRDALDFFYSRMNRGGIILSHDYGFVRCPGVKKAFDEFFDDKPEPVIPLWDTQCAVVRL